MDKNNKKKKITILGSTGSIGVQSLEVIEKLAKKFEIIALSGGDNIKLLTKQIKKFKPKRVCVKTEEGANALKEQFPKLEVLYGSLGLIELTSDKDNDIILVAVSGRVGLRPTVNAINNGIDVALANKETLVMAGEYVMKLAKEKNVKILPVDSEHSAIFQCLQNQVQPRKIIITASGGPFRNKTVYQMQNATVEETLNHPNWNMGKKITVDSATLMNKGLEVIEAHHLFGMDYKDIEVVVHPQSIIHSAVEFDDGSVLAQLGVPSMHIPIQYAITYPNREVGIKTESFNFLENSSLTFEKPDLEKFPCLKLAYYAGEKGGTYPVCLNAANEEAVLAFLEGKIKFWDIYLIVEHMLKKYKNVEKPNIEDIIQQDDIVRTKTRKFIEKRL